MILMYGWTHLMLSLYKQMFFLFSQNPDGLEDWGIIELQGDLEVRGNQIMSGQFIGDLCFDKYGKPVRACASLLLSMV